MKAGAPTVLLVAAKWWPLSARLAAALKRAGCRIQVLCPPHHPLRHLSGINEIRTYASARSLASLRHAMEQGEPDVVVPCDDGVIAQLHDLHQQVPALRELIERSLGDPSAYAVLESRYEFMRVAAELEIPCPKTQKITTAQDLERWFTDFSSAGVLKIDGDSGGNGVRVCRDLRTALEARAELVRPFGLAAAWKRVLVDRDPLAHWRRQMQPKRGLIVQELIAGRPANAMFASRDGKVLEIATVEVLASDGPTGAATVVRRIDSPVMADAASKLAARLGLSGFHGLDFMIEASSGTPLLIECNPRCTQLGHLAWCGQPSLASEFAARWRGEPCPATLRPIKTDTVVLFPQALASGARLNTYLDAGFHDVPWEEPLLARELMLECWPQRQWLARLYHWLRPQQRPAPVEFQGFSPQLVVDEKVGRPP